jgi:integrase
LWVATAALGIFDRALRVLLLTGQRRNELIGMRWSELRLGGPAPEWELPAGRSKNKKPHIIPLSSAVVALLPECVPGSD